MMQKDIISMMSSPKKLVQHGHLLTAHEIGDLINYFSLMKGEQSNYEINNHSCFLDKKFCETM